MRIRLHLPLLLLLLTRHQLGKIEIHLDGVSQPDLLLDVEKGLTLGILKGDLVDAQWKANVDVLAFLVRLGFVNSTNLLPFQDNRALDTQTAIFLGGFPGHATRLSKTRCRKAQSHY